MEFKKENDDQEWQKEDPSGDDLDDRLTAALGGRELLEPDALGVSPDYIPRRPGDGEHGRHEAPEPEEGEPLTDPNFSTSDPRYAAPERPRVVVQEPRRVYVTPPGGDNGDNNGGDDGRRGSKGRGLGWLIGILVALIVIGIVLLLILSGGHSNGTSPTPTPRQTASDASGTPIPTPGETERPTESPSPTDPPKNKHMITVTAGSGGSVTPSGVISVEEGEDVTFTIRPNSGYRLSQVMVDGNSVTLSDTYTFRGVKENHTIYAVFEEEATPTPEPTPTPTPEPEPTPPPTPEPTDPPAPQDDWPDGGEAPPPGGWDEN